MGQIKCGARDGRIIPLETCVPNKSHPSCIKCKCINSPSISLSRKPSHEAFETHKHQDRLKRKLLTRVSNIFLGENIPSFVNKETKESQAFFKGDEYISILIDASHHKHSLALVRSKLQTKVKEKLPRATQDNIEEIYPIIEKAIYNDIEILKWCFHELQKEVENRKRKNASKYREITRWIVEIWGVLSKFILGDDWQKFKAKSGRRSDPSTMQKAFAYLYGSSLKEIGFSDYSKAGTFYKHHRVKNWIFLARNAFSILHYNDIILEILADKPNGHKELFNESRNIRKYSLIPSSVSGKPFKTPFKIYTFEHKEALLEKLEARIESLL